MASRPVASRPVGNASGATAETGSILGAQALLPEPGPSPAVAVCPTQVAGPSPAATTGAVPSPAVAVCPTQVVGPSPAVAVPSPAATTGAVPPLAAASTALKDPSQVAVGFERTRPPGPDLEGAEVPIPAFRHDKACPGRRRCRSAP